MIMEKLWWFSILLMSCAVGQSGVPSRHADRTIRIETAVVDRLGQVYYANRLNEIVKESAEGTRLGYYSNNRLGNITSIDATSPMKVLVFYSAFNTGIVLDRRLLETSQFDLVNAGLGEIDLLAFSRDGTVWVFDDHGQRLYKVNTVGNVVFKGEDLRLQFNQRLMPSKLQEVEDNLLMLVPDRGLVIFDLYGQYSTQILNPDIVDFQLLEEDKVILLTHEYLIDHSLLDHSEVTYILPDIDIEKEKTLLTTEHLVIITQDTIRRAPLQVLRRYP